MTLAGPMRALPKTFVRLYWEYALSAGVPKLLGCHHAAGTGSGGSWPENEATAEESACERGNRKEMVLTENHMTGEAQDPAVLLAMPCTFQLCEPIPFHI